MQIFNVTIFMIGLVLTISIFLLFFVISGIKIIKEWDRAVVFRLGKFLDVRGPGIIWITPILDRRIMVSLKIQQTKVDTDKFTSNDGSTIRVTGYVNWKIIDEQRVVLAVENYKRAIDNIVQHHIKKVCESFPSDAIIIDSESVISEITQDLEPTFTDWGVKIIEIELKSSSDWY